MSAHLSTEAIDRYRSKQITAGEVRTFDSHLAECEDCRRHFRDSTSVDAAYEMVRHSLRSAPESAGPHISYEERAAYVDCDLDVAKREIVEAHLRACRDCEDDVAELMRLKAAITSDEEAGATALPSPAPFWQRTAFRLSLEALAVLLIIAGVIWFSARRIESLRAENEQLRESVREAQAAIAELKNRLDSLEPAGSNGSTAGGPEIAIQLKDGGGPVTLDAQGTLRGLESLPEQYRQAVKTMLETGRVALPPVLAQLRSGPETTMTGNPDEPGFQLLSPVGIVVETNRPMFRWTQFREAKAYEVSVSDASGEVIDRASVSGTDWRPATPLARGRIYQWQVRAITREGREVKSPPVGQPDAKFSVLDRSKLNEVVQARRAYASSHLVLGAVYAKAGLIDEAEGEFRALLAANPESPISRRILGSLKHR